jgi:hypothetical protein
MWAIDLNWLESKAREVLQPEVAEPDALSLEAKAEYLNSLLEGVDRPVIVSVDPQHADERMAAQQGFFLCKLMSRATFNQIHDHDDPSQHSERPVVRKLEVDGKNRIDFLKRLRAMNIHRASLFPDLDGFCQSLRLNSEIKAKGPTREAVLSISDLQKMLEDRSTGSSSKRASRNKR